VVQKHLKKWGLTMFKWLSALGAYFQALWGRAGGAIQTVLHDSASIVRVATPIVEELAALAAAAPHRAGLLAEIENWLATYVKDAPAIGAWLDKAQGLPVSDVLRTAATTAVAALVPGGTAESLINLGVELAYNAFKAARAPGASPAGSAAALAAHQAAVNTIAQQAAAPVTVGPAPAAAEPAPASSAPATVVATVYDEATGQHVNKEIPV
jgi:hypothetical protein